ncbi:small conductance calcium-activated potassium channel protein [Plakobranchus ocellatus]|uniref:Small conductance calcium-activated potassium channel protein n=1 Tax=Plakobranchus ocellatus TaxID=259542 RepID=A0AAV4C0G4_9GAST|nr:small conductance calcium-activated potassium channel protein [Plakobranchus ocellatus]
MQLNQESSGSLFDLACVRSRPCGLRLSGPPPGQGAGCGTRTHDRRFSADLSTDSLATVPLTPPEKYYCRKMTLRRLDSCQEQRIPLVPSKRTRKRTRPEPKYTEMTMIPERPSEPRAFFTKKLGARIEHRKHLLLRRRWLVDLMVSVALIGIALMILENELYYMDASEKDSSVSVMLKLFVTLSTAILLVAICLYYHTGAEIKMLDAKVDDPLAVTPVTTWLLLLIELAVCAVHPFPGDIWVWMEDIEGGKDKVHIDGILSVLMMFRFYLVGRFLVVHSPILTDQSTQTIAAVSHVKISMSFVFKAAMASNPGKVVAFTMLFMFSMSVWAMRTCELYYTNLSDARSFYQSLWLSAITFLTVGYGDLTPMTHCGRFIAIVTGLMGLASTALLVAVMAKKLEQTRPEKYVYNYLSLIHLENKRKNAAADVVKYAIKVYILRKQYERERTKGNRVNLSYASWRLSNAIRTTRSTRVQRSNLEEARVGLTEVSQQVSQTQSLISMLATTQGQILDKLTDLQGRLGYREEEITETEEEEAEDGEVETEVDHD